MYLSSGATPVDLLMASMAASCRFPHSCFNRGRMADSNRRPRVVSTLHCYAGPSAIELLVPFRSKFQEIQLIHCHQFARS